MDKCTFNDRRGRLFTFIRNYNGDDSALFALINGSLAAIEYDDDKNGKSFCDDILSATSAQQLAEKIKKYLIDPNQAAIIAPQLFTAAAQDRAAKAGVAASAAPKPEDKKTHTFTAPKIHPTPQQPTPSAAQPLPSQSQSQVRFHAAPSIAQNLEGKTAPGTQGPIFQSIPAGGTPVTPPTATVSPVIPPAIPAVAARLPSTPEEIKVDIIRKLEKENMIAVASLFTDGGTLTSVGIKIPESKEGAAARDSAEVLIQAIKRSQNPQELAQELKNIFAGDAGEINKIATTIFDTSHPKTASLPPLQVADAEVIALNAKASVILDSKQDDLPKYQQLIKDIIIPLQVLRLKYYSANPASAELMAQIEHQLTDLAEKAKPSSPALLTASDATSAEDLLKKCAANIQVLYDLTDSSFSIPEEKKEKERLSSLYNQASAQLTSLESLLSRPGVSLKTSDPEIIPVINFINDKLSTLHRNGHPDTAPSPKQFDITKFTARPPGADALHPPAGSPAAESKRSATPAPTTTTATDKKGEISLATLNARLAAPELAARLKNTKLSNTETLRLQVDFMNSVYLPLQILIQQKKVQNPAEYKDIHKAYEKIVAAARTATTRSVIFNNRLPPVTGYKRDKQPDDKLEQLKNFAGQIIILVDRCPEGKLADYEPQERLHDEIYEVYRAINSLIEQNPGLLNKGNPDAVAAYEIITDALASFKYKVKDNDLLKRKLEDTPMDELTSLAADPAKVKSAADLDLVSPSAAPQPLPAPDRKEEKKEEKKTEIDILLAQAKTAEQSINSEKDSKALLLKQIAFEKDIIFELEILKRKTIASPDFQAKSQQIEEIRKKVVARWYTQVPTSTRADLSDAGHTTLDKLQFLAGMALLYSDLIPKNRTYLPLKINSEFTTVYLLYNRLHEEMMTLINTLEKNSISETEKSKAELAVQIIDSTMKSLINRYNELRASSLLSVNKDRYVQRIDPDDAPKIDIRHALIKSPAISPGDFKAATIASPAILPISVPAPAPAASAIIDSAAVSVSASGKPPTAAPKEVNDKDKKKDEKILPSQMTREQALEALSFFSDNIVRINNELDKYKDETGPRDIQQDFIENIFLRFQAFKLSAQNISDPDIKRQIAENEKYIEAIRTRLRSNFQLVSPTFVKESEEKWAVKAKFETTDNNILNLIKFATLAVAYADRAPTGKLRQYLFTEDKDIPDAVKLRQYSFVSQAYLDLLKLKTQVETILQTNPGLADDPTAKIAINAINDSIKMLHQSIKTELKGFLEKDTTHSPSDIQLLKADTTPKIDVKPFQKDEQSSVLGVRVTPVKAKEPSAPPAPAPTRPDLKDADTQRPATNIKEPSEEILSKLRYQIQRINKLRSEGSPNFTMLQRRFVELAVTRFEFLKQRYPADYKSMESEIQVLRKKLGEEAYAEKIKNGVSLFADPADESKLLGIPDFGKYFRYTPPDDKLIKLAVDATAFADRILHAKFPDDKSQDKYQATLDCYTALLKMKEEAETLLGSSPPPRELAQESIILINDSLKELHQKLKREFPEQIKAATFDSDGLRALQGDQPAPSIKVPMPDLELSEDVSEPKPRPAPINAEDEDESQEMLDEMLKEKKQGQPKIAAASNPALTAEEEHVALTFIDHFDEVNGLIGSMELAAHIGKDEYGELRGERQKIDLTVPHVLSYDFDEAMSSRTAMAQLDSVEAKKDLDELKDFGIRINRDLNWMLYLQSDLDNFIKILQANGKFDFITDSKAHPLSLFSDGYDKDSPLGKFLEKIIHSPFPLPADATDADRAIIETKRERQIKQFLELLTRIDKLKPAIESRIAELQNAIKLHEEAMKKYQDALDYRDPTKSSHPDCICLKADTIQRQLGGPTVGTVSVAKIAYTDAASYEAALAAELKAQGLTIDPKDVTVQITRKSDHQPAVLISGGTPSKAGDREVHLNTTQMEAAVIVLKPEDKDERQQPTVIVAGQDGDGQRFSAALGRKFDKTQIFYDFLEKQLTQNERAKFEELYDKTTNGKKSPFFNFEAVKELFSDYNEFPPTQDGLEKFLRKQVEEEKAIGSLTKFDSTRSFSGTSIHKMAKKMFEFYMQNIFEPSSIFSTNYVPSHALVNTCQQTIACLLGSLDTVTKTTTLDLSGESPEVRYAMRAVLEAYKLMAKDSDNRVKIGAASYHISELEYADGLDPHTPKHLLTKPSDDVIKAVRKYLEQDYPIQHYAPTATASQPVPLVNADQLNATTLRQAASVKGKEKLSASLQQETAQVRGRVKEYSDSYKEARKPWDEAVASEKAKKAQEEKEAKEQKSQHPQPRQRDRKIVSKPPSSPLPSPRDEKDKVNPPPKIDSPIDRKDEKEEKDKSPKVKVNTVPKADGESKGSSSPLPPPASPPTKIKDDSEIGVRNPPGKSRAGKIPPDTIREAATGIHSTPADRKVNIKESTLEELKHKRRGSIG